MSEWSERDYLRSIVEGVHSDTHEALSATDVAGETKPNFQCINCGWVGILERSELHYCVGNVACADPNCTCSQKCASDAESATERAPGEQAPSPTNPKHYAVLNPQPWDVIDAWGMDYFSGSVLKYLSRWRNKNGLEDLFKARAFLDKLIAIEEGK